MVVTAGERLEGIIQRSSDGFGFFISDNSSIEDIYIPSTYMVGIMSGDRVEISVRKEPGGSRWRGKIHKVLERRFKEVIGKITLSSETSGIIMDQNSAWGEDLHVSVANASSVQHNDWVQIKIKTYPGHSRGFSGELIQVIGHGDNANVDNKRILFQHQIPQDFSKDTLKEIQSIPDKVLKEDLKNRKDLTQLNFVTIDGVTAKDFDDAIYVESSSRGFIVWVAIADVSHYVKPDSALDKDAYDRGTSTYFPGFVNPMLPEKLSNGICSLKPKVNRLAVVAKTEISFQGEVLHSEFFEAVITSKARVTYGQSQELLEDRDIAELDHVAEDIRRAFNVARILSKKRFSDGSLNLDLEETEVQINDMGEPTNIIKAHRLEAHKMIEELMLLANVAVAKFFNDPRKEAVFRIHEPPKPESLENLSVFLKAFGYSKTIGTKGLQNRLSQALRFFSERREKNVVNILVLRSLNQAQYSCERRGHFGLGFSDYTHFTSPIRRYPDLIVHRLIKAQLNVPTYQFPTRITSACTWLSACEQRSVKAERQLISIKKARFMKGYLGKVFEGQISSITKFGVFVLLKDYDVDGLVRLADLTGDHYTFDPVQMQLKGKRTGHTYSLGDSLKVQVAAADTEQGRIDFILENKEPINKKGVKKTRRPTAQDKKKATHRRSKNSKKKQDKKRARNGNKKKKSTPGRDKTKKNRRRVRKARVSKLR